MIHVVAYPHPLRDETIEAEVDPGQTIREIVGHVPVLAWADGHPVPAELIERARLKSGVTLVVRPIPQGKGILRAVLSIGVAIAAAAALGPVFGALGGTGPLLEAGLSFASAGAFAAAFGVGLAGDLVVNARRPPRRPGVA